MASVTNVIQLMAVTNEVSSYTILCFSIVNTFHDQSGPSCLTRLAYSSTYRNLSVWVKDTNQGVEKETLYHCIVLRIGFVLLSLVN